MEPKAINSNRLRGHFVKGESGNPRGRPKGASGRAAEIKRLEEDALKLAINVVAAIAETTRRTLAEVELKAFDSNSFCPQTNIVRTVNLRQNDRVFH